MNSHHLHGSPGPTSAARDIDETQARRPGPDPVPSGQVARRWSTGLRPIPGLLQSVRRTQAGSSAPPQLQRAIVIKNAEELVYSNQNENWNDLETYLTNRGLGDQGRLALVKQLFDDTAGHEYDSHDHLVRKTFGPVIPGVKEPLPAEQITKTDRTLNWGTIKDADGKTWHVSKSVESGEPLSEHKVHAIATSYPTLKAYNDARSNHLTAARRRIQFAVVGGEIYRLILEKVQPRLSYLEVQETNKVKINGEEHEIRETVPYRASSVVPGFRDLTIGTPIEKENPPAEIFLGDEETGLAIVNRPDSVRYAVDVGGGIVKDIRGVFEAFVASVFLGDFDLNAGNLGLADDQGGDHFQAVRLDPEGAFSTLFYERTGGEQESIDEMREKMSLILNDPLAIGKSEDELVADFQSGKMDRFREAFAGNIKTDFDDGTNSSEDDTSDSGEDSSEDDASDNGGADVRKRFECQEEIVASALQLGDCETKLPAILDMITSIAPEKYEEIVRIHISDEFEVEREELCLSLRRRLELFKVLRATLPAEAPHEGEVPAQPHQPPSPILNPSKKARLTTEDRTADGQG